MFQLHGVVLTCNMFTTHMCIFLFVFYIILKKIWMLIVILKKIMSTLILLFSTTIKITHCFSLISTESVSYTHLDVYKRQPFIWLRWNFGELLCARPRRFLPHLLLNHCTDFNQTWHKYFTQRENQHRIGVFSMGSFWGFFGVCLLYTSSHVFISTLNLSVLVFLNISK